MLAFAFTLIDAVRLLRDVEARAVLVFTLGTLGGTPLGVWLLAILTASTFRRLIGALLVRAALLGLMAVRPLRLVWPGWALLAGMLSGVLGGAVHAVGPPVVLYAAGRGRSGRRAKANLQAFFAVNQGAIRVGHITAPLDDQRVLGVSL
jgi:uncharacterized membrane protein YfcA